MRPWFKSKGHPRCQICWLNPERFRRVTRISSSSSSSSASSFIFFFWIFFLNFLWNLLLKAVRSGATWQPEPELTSFLLEPPVSRLPWFDDPSTTNGQFLKWIRWIVVIRCDSTGKFPCKWAVICKWAHQNGCFHWKWELCASEITRMQMKA